MDERSKIKDEGTVRFLLAELKKPETKDDPLTTVAQLFMLKTTMEKSMSARLAFWCFNHDIITVLLGILSMEFNPHDGKSEVAVYSLAAEILWLLSRVKRPTVEPMLSHSNLCATLSQFLDVAGHFYLFGSAFQKQLSNLCGHGSFPQQRVAPAPVTEKIWNEVLYYKSGMKMFGNARPSHLYRCQLTHPNEKTTQNRDIAKHLVNEKLAWTLPEVKPTTSKPLFKSIAELTHPSEDSVLLSSQSEDDVDETVTEREDVQVLNHIGGHYFWAYIGKNALNTVKEISDALSKASGVKACHPCVGKVVAVLENDDGKDKRVAFRGKVLKVQEEVVTVFAMDYGSIRRVKVSSIYRLPESAEYLSTQDAQAKLCCLAGVQAPPASAPTVEFALATLANLTSHNVGKTLIDAKTVDHLYNLLSCGPSNIRLQATRLLSNISSISPFKDSVDWSRFIRPLLGRVIELSNMLCGQRELDNRFKNMAVTTLYALTNFVFRNPANLQLTFDLQGHLIVLNLLRVCRQHMAVREAALKMLKAVFPGVAPVDWDRAYPSGTAQKERNREEAKTPPEMQRGHRDKQNTKRLSPDNKLTNAIESVKKADVTDVSGSELSGTSSSPPVDRSVAVTDTEKSEGTLSLEPHREPVSGTSVCRKAERFYVYGTFVPFQNDQTHHLFPLTSIKCSHFSSIKQTMYGMLNSEGGTIYLGLSQRGCVEGLRLSRGDRDSVRLCVDEMLWNLVPVVTFNQLDVNFVQVMLETPSGKLEPDVNNAVIEIHLRKPTEIHYYTKDQTCFQRKGSENKVLTEQDAREQAVAEEERKHLVMLESLRQQLHHLQTT